jgi:hypothetical protein
LAAGLSLVVGAASARAGVFTFDEFGNGNLPHIIAPDPTGGVAGNVLIYLLPFETNGGGDVRIWENQSMTVLSDVLRFTNADGSIGQQIFDADRFIFYSSIEPGDNAPADAGLPELVLLNGGGGDGGGVVETGGEFRYFAFNGTSDPQPVPEPCTLLVMCITGAAFGANRLRRRIRDSGCKRA